MTEPIAATPGWVDGQLDEIMAGLPDTARPAADAFAECLARRKAPAAPSDDLGEEFAPCHALFRQALLRLGIDHDRLETTLAALEALEAEIAAES